MRPVLNASSTTRVLLFAAALACGFARLAEANDAKAAAISQLKAGAQQAKAALKAALKTQRQALSTQLDSLDDSIGNGAATIGNVADIAAALDTMQPAVRSAIQQLEADLAVVKAQALFALQSAGFAAVADEPTGFRNGDGGFSDQFHADVEKLVRDHVAASSKRLRKTADRFEKKLGIRVSVRLRAPDEFQERAVYVIGGGAIGSAPLTVDYVIAASAIDTTDDGVVYLGGQASQGDGSMDVGMVKKSSSNSTAFTVTANASGRWTFSQSAQSEGDRTYTIKQSAKSAGIARTSVTIP